MATYATKQYGAGSPVLFTSNNGKTFHKGYVVRSFKKELSNGWPLEMLLIECEGGGCVSRSLSHCQTAERNYKLNATVNDLQGKF